VHLQHANEEQVGEAVTLALQLALTKKPSKAKPKTAKARTAAPKARVKGGAKVR
jgi:hypothetical protein